MTSAQPISVGSSTAARRDRRAWALAVIGAILVFCVFIPTLDNEFVDWDDTGVLTENLDYRGLGPTQIAWMFTTNHYGHYQPVTWLTYGVDYVIWGMRPVGYHLTNNLFHAANTLLVFFVALILIRRAQRIASSDRSWPPYVGALLAAILFGAHPLRVESVAWATERRDLVSAFFLLLTVLAYLRATADGEPRRWRWIAITLAIYVVSMLSKVGGAPLPAVLLVLDWYPLRRIGPGPRRWLSAEGRRDLVRVAIEKVPFFVIAIGFSIATVGQQTGKWLMPYEQHSLAARTAQAFYGLVFYMQKTIAPVDLLPLYELHTPLEPLAAMFVVSAVVVLLVAIAALVAWKRVPGLAAAALVYAAMLGPLLGYFQNGPQIVADRYSYLSTLGFVILAAGGIVALLRRAGPARTAGAVLAAAGGVAAVALFGLTWRQNDVWQDTGTLWTHVLERAPDSSFANNSHGFVLFESGRVEESIPFFRKSLTINPQNKEAHYNLWNALEGAGRPGELADAYFMASGAPVAAVRAEAWYRLGNLALAAGDFAGAAERFRRSIVMRETYANAHYNLGIALARAGRFDDALPAYRRALELEPALPGARVGLAAVLERLGRTGEAVAELRAVLSADPGNAAARRALERVEGR